MRIGSVVFAASLLSGCAGNVGPNGVVAAGVFAIGDVTVGHRYRIMEGFTDRGWAMTLLQARDANNFPGVVTAQNQPSFVNTGTCVIQDQPSVEVDDGEFSGYLSCKTDEGVVVYVTKLARL